MSTLYGGGFDGLNVVSTFSARGLISTMMTLSDLATEFSERASLNHFSHVLVFSAGVFVTEHRL